jgi:membrane protease YdiL (CAAX protease family)
MAAVLGYFWSVSGRTPDQLGLHLTLDAAFFTGTVVVLTCVGVLVAQFVSVLRSNQSTIDNLSQKFGRLALIVPHNRRELRIFYAVSVTAGIVEELLWRGYLMWYLTQFFTVGAAAIIVTLGFGLAHAYQGLRNIPKITLVGGAFTVLYLMTGSIWLSMFLHIAIDALQGQLACEISQRSSYGLPERA